MAFDINLSLSKHTGYSLKIKYNTKNMAKIYFLAGGTFCSFQYILENSVTINNLILRVSRTINFRSDKMVFKMTSFNENSPTNQNCLSNFFRRETFTSNQNFKILQPPW